jgi:hypothetical protein
MALVMCILLQLAAGPLALPANATGPAPANEMVFARVRAVVEGGAGPFVLVVAGLRKTVPLTPDQFLAGPFLAHAGGGGWEIEGRQWARVRVDGESCVRARRAGDGTALNPAPTVLAAAVTCVNDTRAVPA